MHNSTKTNRHNATLDLLDKYLTTGYAEEAQTRLMKKGIELSTRTVYAVKSGARKNWMVLEVLAEMASENKAAWEQPEHILNNN